MNRLKELRLNKKENGKVGVTQQEVADRIGVTKRTYIYWEKNERQIKPEKAQQLADYFGVSVGYLLGFEEYYNIENEALDSYKDIKKLLHANPELEKIILEYNESKRKQGKWDLSLVTTTDTIPLIEQNIIDLILKASPETLEEESEEPTNNVTNTYIALGFLPLLFKDFLCSFLTLSTSDKKLVMELVSTLYDKDHGTALLKEYNEDN
jgi:XRE family transcriptional regulator